MKVLRVIDGGLQATVQDAGRPGLRRFGIPAAGAMDQFSYRVANLLAGNAVDAAAIEITLHGFAVEATAPVTLAITGGDLRPWWRDQPAPLWTTLTLQRGDQLRFRGRGSGCRAYLALRGGIESPVFLGSRSTFLKGRMGARLQAGDSVSVSGFHHGPPGATRTLPAPWRPRLGPEQTVRVILGPQQDYFTARGRATFLESVYTISPRSDRQGIRTEGPPVEIAHGPDIITDPTPLGAIQIPGDGQPIVLHRDGQVTGGYAKIARVIAVDLDPFGQLAPGDKVRFQAVTRDAALAAAQQARQQLAVIAALLEGQ